MTLGALLALLALGAWWYRRTVQYEIAERAVQVAELESELRRDTGGLTGAQKKRLAVAAFQGWVPGGYAPLTPLGLDLLIERARRRLKRRVGLR
jgi:hypothetical protein